MLRILETSGVALKSRASPGQSSPPFRRGALRRVRLLFGPQRRPSYSELTFDNGATARWKSGRWTCYTLDPSRKRARPARSTSDLVSPPAVLADRHLDDQIADASCYAGRRRDRDDQDVDAQHNHGWLAATSTGEGGGVYDIGNLDIFMDGFWQITLTATASVALDGGAATSVTDSTVFSFCVDD